jgi:hypothetical protein
MTTAQMMSVANLLPPMPAAADEVATTPTDIS